MPDGNLPGNPSRGTIYHSTRTECRKPFPLCDSKIIWLSDHTECKQHYLSNIRARLFCKILSFEYIPCIVHNDAIYRNHLGPIWRRATTLEIVVMPHVQTKSLRNGKFMDSKHFIVSWSPIVSVPNNRSIHGQYSKTCLKDHLSSETTSHVRLQFGCTKFFLYI